MALTTETIQRLKGKELDKFYEAHKEKFRKMAQAAEKFMRPWLPTGAKLHPADLSSLIVIPLLLDQDWVNLAETSLRGKRWASDFAEYVIDQLYPVNIV